MCGVYTMQLPHVKCFASMAGSGGLLALPVIVRRWQFLFDGQLREFFSCVILPVGFLFGMSVTPVVAFQFLIHPYPWSSGIVMLFHFYKPRGWLFDKFCFNVFVYIYIFRSPFLAKRIVSLLQLAFSHFPNALISSDHDSFSKCILPLIL